MEGPQGSLPNIMFSFPCDRVGSQAELEAPTVKSTAHQYTFPFLKLASFTVAHNRLAAEEVETLLRSLKITCRVHKSQPGEFTDTSTTECKQTEEHSMLPTQILFLSLLVFPLFRPCMYVLFKLCSCHNVRYKMHNLF
jgi:hypothetical protein